MRANSSIYVDQIKNALFDHVQRCQGHAVVLFDEVCDGTEGIQPAHHLCNLANGVLESVSVSCAVTARLFQSYAPMNIKIRCT